MKMIKSKLSLGIVLLLFCTFVTSCSNVFIGSPYTSVSKMSKLEGGMTVEQINSTLGIAPYDVYHLQEDGGTLLTYQYRKQYRKTNVGQEAQMHDQESQTSGRVWYKDPTRMYVFLKNNQMQALVTEAGIADGEGILIDNNTIQIVSQDDISLFTLAKNEGIQDSTYKYAIKATKDIGKVTIYQSYWVKQKVELTLVPVARPKLSISNIKRTRALPAYKQEKSITNDYRIAITAGYNNSMAGIMGEFNIINSPKFQLGAQVGFGKYIMGSGITIPVGLAAAFTFDNNRMHSIELLANVEYIPDYYSASTYVGVGYKLCYQRFIFRVGAGLGSSPYRSPYYVHQSYSYSNNYFYYNATGPKGHLMLGYRF